MSAPVITSVVPALLPGFGGRVAAGDSAGLPLVRPPLPLPSLISRRTSSVVYGLAALDDRGRVADRVVMHTLGWPAGLRLAINEAGGVLTVHTDPHGDYQVTGQGHLRLPAALRHRCGLAAGDRVLLLARLGVSAADLIAAAEKRTPAPTFAEYIPMVRAAVSDGTRRVYGSYWNRIVDHWGTRRLDEPTPSEIQQLAEHVKANVVARRNARGGRSAAEHLIAALRCIYRHAENDKHITAADNPARKVTKPRRLPSDRRAVPGDRLAEINHAAATTGSDPALDTLILRLHTETACRRGGALALTPADLDPDQCLIRLREKGETIRWQPVSPTLMAHLQQHADQRRAPANGQLLRYANGRPITSRRYDHLWVRIGRHVPWVATQQISTHWLRHTTLTWVERNFGYAIARAYAGHTDNGNAGTTATYVRASLPEIATALAALTAESHPLALGETRHQAGGDTQ